MQQLRHPAPARRTSGSPAGGGVAARGTAGEPAGPRSSQSTVLSWTFPGTALDVSLSRRWLAAAVRALWGAGDDADRLVLAYSEVATNAVVHGRGPVTVTARIRLGGATCEVADCSDRAPQPRRADPEDVSGRGLDLVEQTVDRLRVTAGETGKTVRFEVGRQTAAAGGSGGSPPPESGGGPVGGAGGVGAASEDEPPPDISRGADPDVGPGANPDANPSANPGPDTTMTVTRYTGAAHGIPPVPHPALGRHHRPGTARSSVGGSAGGSTDGNPPRRHAAFALGEAGG